MPRRVRYADHAGVWPAVLASMPRVAWTELDRREGVSTRRSCATLPGRRACRGEAEPATMKLASCLPAGTMPCTARRKQAQAASRRREVVVGGRRVQTIDVHAHCVVPKAMELLGQTPSANESRGPGISEVGRCAVCAKWTHRASTSRRSASTRSGTGRTATSSRTSSRSTTKR